MLIWKAKAIEWKVQPPKDQDLSDENQGIWTDSEYIRKTVGHVYQKQIDWMHPKRRSQEDAEGGVTTPEVEPGPSGCKTKRKEKSKEDTGSQAKETEDKQDKESSSESEDEEEKRRELIKKMKKLEEKYTLADLKKKPRYKLLKHLNKEYLKNKNLKK